MVNTLKSLGRAALNVILFICLMPFWPLVILLLWFAQRGDIGVVEADPVE